MNKPKITKYKTKESKNVQIQMQLSVSMIGYMYKLSENLSYTVYKCQQAKITLLFVPTSIFTFSYTTDVQ